MYSICLWHRVDRNTKRRASSCLLFISIEIVKRSKGNNLIKMLFIQYYSLTTVYVCVCVCLSLNAHPRHHTYSSTTLKLHSCDRSFALRISFFSHYLSLHIFGYLIFCLTLPRCLQAHGLNYCHFQLDATRYRGFASLLWCMIWYDTIVYVYTLKCASAFAVLL